MNKRDCDILLALSTGRWIKQRDLAKACGYSLGAVNASLKKLSAEGYLDENAALTEKSRELIKHSTPARAVILAEDGSMRIPPHNAEQPRPLLKVRGEKLIERIIHQLHEAGIFDICIVVGFAKEQFEYLIDQYGAELVVNPGYAQRGTLHSLALAKDWLRNCYLLPGDVWFRENPFRSRELYSWYMTADAEDIDSSVRVNRKQELVVVPAGAKGNPMMGVGYLCGADAERFTARLAEMEPDYRHKSAGWEEALFTGDKLWICPKLIRPDEAVRVTTFEELEELEKPLSVFNFQPADEIARLIGCREKEIENISVLKKGSTNSSYIFSIRNDRYILRLPKDGADQMINHAQEAQVYKMLRSCEVAEEIVCYEADTGLKISRYIENAHMCDPFSESDVKRCMKTLRKFHEMELSVTHEFDLFDRIDYFESLWTTPSVYTDYQTTKENVYSLRTYIDSMEKKRCLTHMDAVHENFLIPDEETEDRGIRLIDWEYAAMQDPHVDIAMYGLYAMYSREQMDALISAYFPEGCRRADRIKIYCYIAVGGLLWSNWCEFKHQSGTQFGEYSLRQYRYAKEYYRIVQDELSKGE